MSSGIEYTDDNESNSVDEHEDEINEDEQEDEINDNSKDAAEAEINENSEDEHEDEINGNIDASSPEDEEDVEKSEVELVVQENSSKENEDGEETSQVESVALENRADEVDPLPTTRSGRTYKPYDWAKHFPEKLHILNIERVRKTHGHAHITLMIQATA